MTNAEKLHKRRLAEIGCMVCRRLWGINDGPVEVKILYASTVHLLKCAQCIRLAGPMHHFPNHCHERTSGMSNFNSTENWTSAYGYEPYYEISDLGRVRSLSRNVLSSHGRNRHFTGKILKPIVNSVGYAVVNLSVHGKKKQRTVHSMVLESFICPKPDGTEACHSNGIRTDARLSNLRWDTRVENHYDKIGHGTHLQGELHGNAKLTDEIVIHIRAKKMRACDAARQFGISKSNAKRIVNLTAWKHIHA